MAKSCLIVVMHRLLTRSVSQCCRFQRGVHRLELRVVRAALIFETIVPLGTFLFFGFSERTLD